MAGLRTHFGPSDIYVGVAVRTLEGGEASSTIRGPSKRLRGLGGCSRPTQTPEGKAPGRVRVEGWEGQKSHLVYLLHFMRKLRAIKAK